MSLEDVVGRPMAAFSAQRRQDRRCFMRLAPDRNLNEPNCIGR